MDLARRPAAAVAVRPRATLISAELMRGVVYRAVLLAIVIGPSSLSFTIDGRGSDWTRDPVVRLVDAPLFVIAALGLVPVFGRCVAFGRAVRNRSATVEGAAFVLLAAMVLWVAASWAMQPRAIGGVMVVRLVGVLGVVDLVLRATWAQRAVIVKTVIGLVVFEAFVCVGQLIVDGPVGVQFLGELADPFNRTGPWRAPTGTSYYPYPLSAVALLGVALALWAVDRRLIGRWWAVAAALGAGIVIGTGYSVIAAAVLLGLVAAFVVRRVPAGTRRFRGVGAGSLAVFVVAFGVTGAVLREGWLWKGERSASTSTAVASSGRTDQLEVGFAMAKRWPLFGIGAGNFAVVRELHQEFNDVSIDNQIPHSMPVLVAVESGFLALGCFGLSLALLAWRKVRAVGVVGVSLAGYVLGDLMHWYSGFGMFFLALWLSFLFVAREPLDEGAIAVGERWRSASVSATRGLVVAAQ